MLLLGTAAKLWLLQVLLLMIRYIFMRVLLVLFPEETIMLLMMLYNLS